MTATQTGARNLRRSLESLARCDASPEQKAYMLAKAAHGAAKDCVAKGVTALGPKPTLGTILRWAGYDGGADPDSDSVRLSPPVQALFALAYSGIGEDGEYYEDRMHPYFRAKQELEERYKLWPLAIQLTDAENAMVAWGRENARRGLGGRFAQIEKTFDAWPLFGDLRAKFVDIVMRMEVSR
jgi:hypothetical protein